MGRKTKRLRGAGTSRGDDTGTAHRDAITDYITNTTIYLRKKVVQYERRAWIVR